MPLRKPKPDPHKIYYAVTSLVAGSPPVRIHRGERLLGSDERVQRFFDYFALDGTAPKTAPGFDRLHRRPITSERRKDRLPKRHHRDYVVCIRACRVELRARTGALEMHIGEPDTLWPRSHPIVKANASAFRKATAADLVEA